MMAMSSVAMLDIYVAFFITLSIWFALRKNYFLSALAIGFASSCKLTGVFSIAGLFFFMVVLRKPGVKKIVLCAAVVPLLVWFLFNSPLILRFGFQRWSEDLGRGLAWHVTSRPPGPAVSTPWGWFVNENPFALNFAPDISASVNSVVYVMALISMIFIPYLARKVSRDYLIPSFWFGFTFLGYVAVYLLGNRTLYSFYVVSLSPMVYILTCVLIYHIIKAVQEHFKT
jgi:predicted membrane-bound dolichyl-phosphate-mannose-protein mannosyltransferase